MCEGTTMSAVMTILHGRTPYLSWITLTTSMLSIPSNMLARALDGSVTITGIAQDEAGRVAGVEVSTDHGATWHPAEGRERCSLLGSHVALDR
jgi:hypothetical protein